MIFTITVVLLALFGQAELFKFGGSKQASVSISAALQPQQMALPMPPLPQPEITLPEIDTLYRAPLLVPTPAYYPLPAPLPLAQPSRQPEIEQNSLNGIKGGGQIERQPELARPLALRSSLSLGPQTVAYVLVRPVQQTQYQYLEPLRYASRYQPYPRSFYQAYRTEDKSIKGQQQESLEQQTQQFEEQKLEPQQYDQQQPIAVPTQQPQQDPISAKKSTKFLKLRNSLDKIASKLQPSSYQVVSEEYLLPQPQPQPQQPSQQQQMQQQTIEQSQQLEQLPQIEQQRPELDIKGGEQQQEQTREGQHQEKLDESLKTRRERVKSSSNLQISAQAPTAQAEDKNHGF